MAVLPLFALALAIAPVPAPVLPPGAAQGQRRQPAAADTETGGGPRQGVHEQDGIGWLVPTSDGGLLYEDPGRRFKAYIGADGSVVFAKRWRRHRRRRVKPSRRERRRADRCCGSPAGGLAPAVNVFSGAPASGPTEWAFAARGRDPSAAAKAEFLARTAPLRTRLAKDSVRAQMQDALDALEDDLSKLWGDDALSAAQKRVIVFERWDGLADASSHSDTASTAKDLDALRAAYASRARRRIEAFVRRELPKDSAVQFPATELASLNAARRGTALFDPYTRATR